MAISTHSSGVVPPGVSQGPSSSTTAAMSLEQWVERLSAVELPAVSSTVRKIQQLTGDEGHAIQALADAILQDAAMTTHILRLTSSAYHVRNNRTNSITRAIVTLGTKEVRSLCLSIAVMGGLISQGEATSLSDELARAFHGAVQAEQLACAIGDRAPQEVFIAALLFDLGRMMFWCFGGSQAELLREAFAEQPEFDEAEIEKQVLGFELRELTAELSKRWGLGDLLSKALAAEKADSSRVHGVRLGNRFAKAVERGWTSPKTQALVEEMASLTGLSSSVLTPMLHSAASKAKTVAQEFNAAMCIDRIPSPPVAGTTVERAEPFVPPQPDQQYQLTSLRDISLKLDSFNEVQQIIDLILDGIYRGVGMDRVLFAILSPNRKYLIGKAGFGHRAGEFVENFKFATDEKEPNIFQMIVDGQKAVWIEDPNAPEYQRLISANIRGIIGESAAFVAPVIVTGKPIGVIYADRQVSKRPLDVETFQAFKQFVLTANLSLEHFKALHSGRS